MSGNAKIKNYRGFVRMPNLRIPKNTRIDYRGFLVSHGEYGESVLLTSEELAQLGGRTIEEKIAECADKPVVEHSERFGDREYSRRDKVRRWILDVEQLPEGMRLNYDGEVVRDREDGREEVIVSKEDFAQYPGKSAMEIIALKEKQAERAG